MTLISLKILTLRILPAIELGSILVKTQHVAPIFFLLILFRHLSWSNKKILLKRLCARVLPPEFDKQRKQGFSIPIAEWLKAGAFRELFWDTLSSADCMFDTATVQGLLKGQDQGRNNGERLFALVQFELWRKAYNVNFSKF